MRRNWPWSLPQQLQKTKVLKRRHWKAFFSTPCNTWKPIEFATRHLKDRQHSKNTQYETNSCLNSKKFPARGKFVKTIESWHLSKNDNCKMSLWSSIFVQLSKVQIKKKELSWFWHNLKFTWGSWGYYLLRQSFLRSGFETQLPNMESPRRMRLRKAEEELRSAMMAASKTWPLDTKKGLETVAPSASARSLVF